MDRVKFLIVSDKTCTGCGACVAACPNSCLLLSHDACGILRPYINNSRCDSCDKCKKVCPINNLKSCSNAPLPLSYVLVNNDEAIRLSSSSGGVFWEIAKWVIKKRGVVFGARFNEAWEVIHDYTESIDGVAAFMQSKYVQSNIGYSFAHVQKFLEVGRWVLFSGTPCQVAGLRSFLKKNWDRLITVDFICHGVPSPGVWKKYLSESYLKEFRVDKINFRDKRKGWRKQYTSLECVKGEASKKEFFHSAYDSVYMQGFYYNYFLMKACYDCAYKSIWRESDITLADAWGIEEYARELDDDRGASVVLIHTDRGVKWLEENEESFKMKSVKINQVIKYNKYLCRSVNLSNYRSLFYILNKFLSVSISVKITNIIKKILPF